MPEVKIARQLRFEAGTIVVCDRGYIDYQWFKALTEEGVFFVTRMRTDMGYRIVEERQVPQNRNVLADQVVYLGSRNVME